MDAIFEENNGTDNRHEYQMIRNDISTFDGSLLNILDSEHSIKMRLRTSDAIFATILRTHKIAFPIKNGMNRVTQTTSQQSSQSYDDRAVALFSQKAPFLPVMTSYDKNSNVGQKEEWIF